MLEGIKKIFGGSKDEGAPKVEEKVEAAPQTPVETAPAEETYWLHSLKWLYWRCNVFN